MGAPTHRRRTNVYRNNYVVHLYLIATAYYWGYALYQELTIQEFGTFLAISTGIFLGAWILCE